MLDTLAYIIGYTVIYGTVGIISLGLLTLLYWVFTATLDVLSQYYLLWRENRKPAADVTFGLAWWTSFDMQGGIWGRIWLRLKRAHGYSLPPMPDDEWKPGR